MGSDNTNQLRASATPTLWQRNGRPPYSQRICGPRGQEEASNAVLVVEIGGTTGRWGNSNNHFHSRSGRPVGRWRATTRSGSVRPGPLRHRLTPPLGADNSGLRLEDHIERRLRRPPHAAAPSAPDQPAQPCLACLRTEHRADLLRLRGRHADKRRSGEVQALHRVQVALLSARRLFAAPTVGSPLAVATTTELERHPRGAAAHA
jgi:hypothetical protein